MRGEIIIVFPVGVGLLLGLLYEIMHILLFLLITVHCI